MLEASGLEPRLNHPINWRLPWQLWHRRNHRKLIIADGCRAAAGSANWEDAYNCELNPACYRDLGLELCGPVVAQLEEDFKRSWARAGGVPSRAVPELEAATHTYVTNHNVAPKLFIRTAAAKEVLAKVAHARKALDDGRIAVDRHSHGRPKTSPLQRFRLAKRWITAANAPDALPG